MPQCRSSSAVAPSLAALVALVAFTALHWHGVGLSPDGWAYWQGAVSLAEGQGYAYFSGTPLTSWPPLFSAYLAAWTWLTGPTVATLAVASGTLVVAQAALWCWVALALRSRSQDPPSLLTTGFVAVYLGLFTTVNQQAPLAHMLLYALVPVILLATWRARDAATSQTVLRWATVSGAACTAALLTHNGAIAFVAASALLVLSRRDLWRTRLAATALVAVFPVAVWSAVRLAMGQVASHETGLGVGKHGPGEYLFQLGRGIGSLVVPNFAGGPWVVVAIGACLLMWAARSSRPLVVAATFVGIATVVTYALFNLTWVNDELGGRFVLFVPAVLVPAMALALPQNRRLLTALFFAGTLLPLVYWTFTWVGFNSTPESGVIGHTTRLSSDYRAGPPLYVPGGVLVAPPAWEEPAASPSSR